MNSKTVTAREKLHAFDGSGIEAMAYFSSSWHGKILVAHHEYSVLDGMILRLLL